MYVRLVDILNASKDMKYLRYLKYLLKHKYYVFIECLKRRFIWRGITHDLSKFLPDEFIAYANYFYGNYPEYRQVEINRKLDLAWLRHQKRNKHHWQYWVLIEDSGDIKPQEIPYQYLIEMLCDWIGASRALGFISPKEDPLLEVRKWYRANKDNMIFACTTRQLIETILKEV